MAGYRHRYMYYLTGLPGWMRFGFSPGWGTLPPGAQYLMTGTWPTWQANWAWQNMPQTGYFDPYGIYQITPEQELQILKSQAFLPPPFISESDNNCNKDYKKVLLVHKFQSTTILASRETICKKEMDYLSSPRKHKGNHHTDNPISTIQDPIYFFLLAFLPPPFEIENHFHL